MNYRYDQYEVITSKSNQIIKATKKLYESKFRKERSQFILDGERFIFDNAANGIVAEYVIATEKYAQKIDEKVAGNAYFVTQEVYSYLSRLRAPQGIMAVYATPKADKRTVCGNKLLFLDAVQNPDNVGAIIRSAVCAGFDVVLKNDRTADCFSEKSVRAAAGSIFQIPIYDIKDDDLFSLKSEGYQLVATDLNGDESIEGIEEKFILAIGNEGQGVSESVKSNADKRIKLPLYGKCESLNAACAATVLMYKIIGY